MVQLVGELVKVVVLHCFMWTNNCLFFLVSCSNKIQDIGILWTMSIEADRSKRWSFGVA